MTLKKLAGGLALTFLIAMVTEDAKAGTSSICDAISGNLIQNCGFETGDLTDWSVSNWTTLEDYVVSNPTEVNSGNYALQIGNVAASGGAVISQSFTDIAGAHYQFTFSVFDGAGSNTSGQFFDAFWDSTSGTPLFSDAGGGSPSLDYTEETFSVVGTGSDSITFTAYNNPNWFYLDDASVVETSGPAGAPEPTSAILLMLGIAGITTRIRYRIRA